MFKKVDGVKAPTRKTMIKKEEVNIIGATLNRYTFAIAHDFEDAMSGVERYIEINRLLTPQELSILSHVLETFPHASLPYKWPNVFSNHDYTDVPKDLLAIVANAYDSYGNTMLGIAAEHGVVPAVQRLIDMGAKLNARDKSSYLAIRWAINNKPSSRQKTSYEAAEVVKCLLTHGVRTDMKSPSGDGDVTPLQYAQKRGFIAAADLIERKEKALLLGGGGGLFNKKLPPVLGRLISEFLPVEDGYAIIRVNKEAQQASKNKIVEELAKSPSLKKARC